MPHHLEFYKLQPCNRFYSSSRTFQIDLNPRHLLKVRALEYHWTFRQFGGEFFWGQIKEKIHYSHLTIKSEIC